MNHEEQIDNKNYLKAVIACRDAYQNALYHRCLHSNILIGSIPFLAELQLEGKQDWFFDNLLQQIEVSRWGIDLIRYERFLEILDHIPLEERADSRGGARVLQRAWCYEDAAYCYQFVSDFILRLQQKEFSPLYEITNISDRYKFIEKLNGIDLSSTFEDGCSYSYSIGDNLRLLYVNRNIKEELEKLNKEDEYEQFSESYLDGMLNFRSRCKVKIKVYTFQVATENPERWRIVLWTQDVPFSLNKEEYKEGNKVEENISVNLANVEELTSVYSVTKEIAEKIIEYRNVNGPILCIEQLKEISGISKQQIDWIVFTTKT